MDWKKLSPWNWLKNEQRGGHDLPVTRKPAEPSQHPVASLHQEIDRVFDQVFRGFGLSALPEWPALGQSLLKPSLDISENRDSYTISLEIPGVSKDDIQISVEDDSLIIQGEKREESERKEDEYHYTERHYGSFQRVLALPTDADADNLKASFRNGVLNITIGRRAESPTNGRKVQID